MSTNSLKCSIIFIGIWTLAINCTSVNSQCHGPKEFYQVLETDPAGTQIFNLPAPGGISWRYTLPKKGPIPIREYVNFVRDQDTYHMTLLKPLDLEELRDKYNFTDSLFTFMMHCNKPPRGEVTYTVITLVKPVNEYAPQFNMSSLNASVHETSKPVTVINLIDWASDKDQNTLNREIAAFNFVPPLNPLLGMRAYKGSVYILSGLDYESLPKDKKYLTVGVQVKDLGGKVGTANLTIHVLNADDLPPKFIYRGCPVPCGDVLYIAEFNANAKGTLTGIKPGPILAIDGDDLEATITYKIKQAPANVSGYVSMDPVTAEVTILKPLHSLQMPHIVFIIEAQENTVAKRTAQTSLMISVLMKASPSPLQPVVSYMLIVGAVLCFMASSSLSSSWSL